MEILKAIGEIVLVIIAVLILWKPVLNFIGHAWNNAYGRLVQIGGAIIVLIVAGLLFSMLGPK